ncbi:hypothetical protein EMIHUDRAFT_241505 [Emiliania huxleyi CCMP1516]|uniref:Uncharacterized protein n=2 Tax=Emiliania huxleyi TaxID=2903 RepID=A0A0D3JCK3_EMIH1|nr:hypothetical protein EMIHUDRAFT_241505 [Emiliania huxleyi CCMP1516]EOD21238.1 hypothetical protein EMIHUDRAFT_241505 [Emiliania huxleyi CCMP1516]|eukprot:XP_005773667.1 hypothetical protein EMIHUDRAFT_241505 [Emiliania huxleyi CCMP1516]
MQSLQLSRKRAYVFGRSRERADFAVPDESVSRSFLDTGAGWERLSPHKPTRVPCGAKIKLGDCDTVLTTILPSTPAVDVAAARKAKAEALPFPELSNSDFRNALLPFLASKKANGEGEGEDGGDRKRKKKKKRRRGDDSDDSDAEPPPPLKLDKAAAAVDPGGGFVLRKQKAQPGKRGPTSSKKEPKIKF